MNRFRKTSRRPTDFAAQIQAITEALPEDAGEVEVWAMDEHRVGLKPVLKRVWAPIGGSLLADVNPRYDWLYLYAFVHPSGGDTFWLILPRVDGVLFSLALEAFAEWIGAGKQTEIILVVDQAGFHFGKTVTVPPGIHLLPLPPYSPELQPAERLWEIADEPVVNQVFDDIEDMEIVFAKRCLELMERTEEIKTRTNFHWWQKALRKLAA